LFENAEKVHWKQMKEAMPVFFITCLVPYSYSILIGIIYGAVFYVLMYICTSEYAEAYENIKTTFINTFGGRSDMYDDIDASTKAANDEFSSLLDTNVDSKGEKDSTISKFTSSIRTIFSGAPYTENNNDHKL
jgi:hypothetical protein